MKPPSRAFSVIVGLGLFAFTAVMGVQASLIPLPVMQDALGPRLLPGALCGLLLILAMGYTQAAWQDRSPDVINDEAEAPLPGRAARCAWFIGGLAALLALIPAIGIGAACALAFVLFARAFGSRAPLKDLLIGGLFSLAVWGLFDKLLGVPLGPFLHLP
ncbi:MAG: tripartite tricarboxylate transporter TctB family protein [Candidatus Dactylopiibacterium sp.]|nr:tripartite tricarboxylate transporter TctB family protein [Candidatus Dactylopiibacterium sp.]